MPGTETAYYAAVCYAMPGTAIASTSHPVSTGHIRYEDTRYRISNRIKATLYAVPRYNIAYPTEYGLRVCSYSTRSTASASTGHVGGGHAPRARACNA
eukprot:1353316-Rhodomonas_salina.1